MIAHMNYLWNLALHQRELHNICVFLGSTVSRLVCISDSFRPQTHLHKRFWELSTPVLSSLKMHSAGAIGAHALVRALGCVNSTFKEQREIFCIRRRRPWEVTNFFFSLALRLFLRIPRHEAHLNNDQQLFLLSRCDGIPSDKLIQLRDDRHWSDLRIFIDSSLRSIWSRSISLCKYFSPPRLWH